MLTVSYYSIHNFPVCPHLGSQRNFVFSPSSLQINHSLKEGWTNILVPSLLFTRKTDRLSTRCWKSSQSSVPCRHTHCLDVTLGHRILFSKLPGFLAWKRVITYCYWNLMSIYDNRWCDVMKKRKKSINKSSIICIHLFFSCKKRSSLTVNTPENLALNHT